MNCTTHFYYTHVQQITSKCFGYFL